MMLRLILCGLTALALGACSSDKYSDGPLTQAIKKKTDTSPEFFARFQPLYAARQGQATAREITVLDLGAKGGFLLESRQGQIESWLGTDGVSLVFDRGLLQGTRGLGAGLLGADVSQSAALVLGGRSGVATRLHSYIGGDDRVQTQRYRCRITPSGQAAITLDKGPVTTRMVSEVCEGPDARFENTYWIDNASNQIVQSKQWSGPRTGLLQIKTVYNF